MRETPLDEAMLLVEDGAGFGHPGPGVAAECVVVDRESRTTVDSTPDCIVNISILPR